MTALACLHCTADTEGIVLCSRCQRTVARALENIRSYHADLFTLAPPPPGLRRRGDDADPTGNAVMRISSSDPVEDLADRARNTLSTWVRALIDDRPQLRAPANTIDAMARLLIQHVRSVATLGWAGDYAREVTGLERDLRRFIETHKERWFAGKCGYDAQADTYQPSAEGACTRVLYADKESTFVRCPVCHTQWEIRERRAHLLEQARGVETNVAVIARALVVLLDGEVSQARLQNRIDQWIARGKIERRGHVDTDGQVRKVYRLGDVLDMLMSDRSDRSA